MIWQCRQICAREVGLPPLNAHNFWLMLAWRLFYFFLFLRLGIEFLSSWLLNRLALPTFDNSPRLSFKTDGTKLDQDSIQLETGAAISAFSRPRPPPPVFIAVPFFLFIFILLFFLIFLSCCRRFFSIRFLLSSILFCTRRRDFQARDTEKKGRRRPFCAREW